jgi:4-carboxymuconolactone decarboxylase
MTSSHSRQLGPAETVPPKKTTLPADVHPQSRSRLPLVKREDMDEAGKKAYDAVVDPNSRLKAQLLGPAGIWLNVPELSPHIREINWFLRNQFPLDAKLTELVILATARQSDAQIEWSAHEPAALKAGLAQNVIDIVKFRRPIENVDAKEAVIIKFARELLGDNHLTSETYAEALKLFGQKTLVMMVLLMANYSQTAIILHAFDQQLRPELTPLLPVAGHE